MSSQCNGMEIQQRQDNHLDTTRSSNNNVHTSSQCHFLRTIRRTTIHTTCRKPKCCTIKLKVGMHLKFILMMHLCQKNMCKRIRFLESDMDTSFYLIGQLSCWQQNQNTWGPAMFSSSRSLVCPINQRLQYGQDKSQSFSLQEITLLSYRFSEKHILQKSNGVAHRHHLSSIS